MLLKSLRAIGVVYFALLVATHHAGTALGQTRPDSLTLQTPTNLFVEPVMNVNRQIFVNYLFWEDVPDIMGTFIHHPDTAGWHTSASVTVIDSLSEPSSSGIYTGSIDRTIRFMVIRVDTSIGPCEGPPARVGVSPFKIRYEILQEEHFSRTIIVPATYVPGDPIRCIFNDERNPGQQVDFGLNLHLSDGLIECNSQFVIGVEDFEGFHMWRGIEPDGSDLVVIGEVSKEEQAAGSVVDSLYFAEIIPALRTTGVYSFGFPVAGLGTTFDIRNVHPNGRLGPNEFAWFDANTFNGFTYQYVVTTFDRGYSVSSQSQGLSKFDHCPVTQGEPFPCDTLLFPVSTIVTPQDELWRVYAVPNPYRSGTSQFTAPNYHNYPDNKMRFVNVPAECTLKIFTVAGDLVWEVQHNSTFGNIEWDTRNLAGREVSSGAYLYRLETKEGDSVYGRIVIIR